MKEFKHNLEHFFITLLEIFNASLNIFFAILFIFCVTYLVSVAFGFDFIIVDIIELQRKNNGTY